MLTTGSHRFSRNFPIKPAFSLIELLTVIAIMSVLIAVSAQVFSNSGNSARKASRDIIRTHIQQARAHAIASGNFTALAIPVLATNGGIGGRALSLIEVEKNGNVYVPITDADGQQRLLQRWEILPGDFHFIPSSVAALASPTIVDAPDTLQTNFKGNPVTCHVIVFTPNGQIILPNTNLNLAIARARNESGTLIPLERNNGVAVYDHLLINRLTGRTRFITP